MSFPYTTLSPPPTSGALSLVNNANASQSYYAPAGGGGGGGSNPNPVVSTITFSQGSSGSELTDGMIFMNNTLNLLDLNSPTPQNNNFQFVTNVLTASVAPIVEQYQSTFNGTSLWGPNASLTDTGNLALSADGLGRSLILATNATGNLSSLAILADTIVVPTGMNISSLTVSSINGGNLAVSAISTSIATFPNSAAFPGTGIVMDTNLTINDINNANASDYMFISNQPEPTLANFSTNAFFINAPAGVGGVLSLKSCNNSTSMIMAADSTSALRPLEVVCASMNVSSINVSSINGAAPGGGGGSYPVVSTLKVGGGGAQTLYTGVSTNSAALISDNFDLQIGHYYNLKWDYAAIPTATAGLNDFSIFNISNVPLAHHAAPLAYSSLTQGVLGFFATGNVTAALQVETNTTTECAINLNSAIDNIVLTDFGTQ